MTHRQRVIFDPSAPEPERGAARLVGLLLGLIIVAGSALIVLDTAMAVAHVSHRVRNAVVFTGCNVSMLMYLVLASGSER